MAVAVVMPAYNEAEAIAEFLTELNAALAHAEPSFIVVDDASTDGTADVVLALAAAGMPVALVRNESNQGHGPSTMRALREALERGALTVVAVDGDGQFRGADVALALAALLDGAADVVEGVRVLRRGPSYRRAVSRATQALVWTRARSWPGDANTPLRVYRRGTLTTLLDVIPSTAATPNLLISAACRRLGLAIEEVEVMSLPRRGTDSTGSTWGASRPSLPSRRFVAFCALSVREWARTPLPAPTHSPSS
ncbi:unannotated protein [freshwater metagenome]|uniref:Unannotated protein n=1 Tax=freshwater metagenome TaxID=449393 RepID=A0A6J7P6N1_9ZZZZ